MRRPTAKTLPAFKVGQDLATMNRAARRSLGHRGPLQEGVSFIGGPRTDIKHGVCKHCGHRKILWQPAGLCERGLLDAAKENGLILNPEAFGAVFTDEQLDPETPSKRELALAELDRMENELC